MVKRNEFLTNGLTTYGELLGEYQGAICMSSVSRRSNIKRLNYKSFTIFVSCLNCVSQNATYKPNNSLVKYMLLTKFLEIL